MCIQCWLYRLYASEGGGGEISSGLTVKLTGAVGDNEVWLSGDGVEDVIIVDGGWGEAGS